MKKSKSNRILEVVIGVALVVVLVYIVSVAVKVTTGVSKTTDTPAHLIRLQVLNACGVTGVASQKADDLSGYSDEDVEIVIVDTDNFDIREVPESFVISRTKNKTAAKLLARKLGLDDSGIESRLLENNYRHVSVTLVLGQDYESVRLVRAQDAKEK